MSAITVLPTPATTQARVAIDIDLGPLNNLPVGTASSVVFYSDWVDPEWGLGNDLQGLIGPAGFDVAPDGSLVMLDPVNLRIIKQDIAGDRKTIAIPELNPPEVYDGITVSRKHIYLLTTERLFALTDDVLNGVWSAADLNLSAMDRYMTADESGVWARPVEHEGWRRVLSDELVVTQPDASQLRPSASDPFSQHPVLVLTPAPDEFVLQDGMYDLHVDSTPGLDGADVYTVRDGITVLVTASIKFRGFRIVVLLRDGRLESSFRLPVATGGLLQDDGVKFRMRGGSLFFEEGLASGVRMSQLPLNL